ncbi:MAG: aldo/keto reductase [Proteobacteria bacterium]|nr:MAG: aldo/keto reductase [Pseudomonadota bacterium]
MSSHPSSRGPSRAPATRTPDTAADRSPTDLTRRALLRSGTLLGVGLGVGMTFGQETLAAESDLQKLPLIAKPIPSTGEMLPVVGLGTNAYSVTSAEDLAVRREVLRHMPELGGKVIDTAQAYGRSEEVIGQLLAELGNRERFFLATKPPLAGDVSAGAAVLEGAFERLRVERIDLMQIHNLHGIESLLPAMREFKQDGRIRYLGITTSTDAQYPGLLDAMRKHDFDFVQVDYSIGNRSAAEEVLPLAQARGMAVLVNMPLGGRRGTNLLAQARGRALPPWAADIQVTSWAQFLLKYVVSHPAVTCVIPGTTKRSHLEDNQGAARGVLPDAAMRQRMEAFWTELS